MYFTIYKILKYKTNIKNIYEGYKLAYHSSGTPN